MRKSPSHRRFIQRCEGDFHFPALPQESPPLYFLLWTLNLTYMFFIYDLLCQRLPNRLNAFFISSFSGTVKLRRKEWDFPPAGINTSPEITATLYSSASFFTNASMSSFPVTSVHQTNIPPSGSIYLISGGSVFMLLYIIPLVILIDNHLRQYIGVYIRKLLKQCSPVYDLFVRDHVTCPQPRSHHL